MKASASIASDHFHLFGPRLPTDPPLLAPANVSSLSTSLDVLGWTIATVTMVISLTSAKLLRLSLLLEAWPPARAVASEYELRSLVGKLLHVSEVVRPAKTFRSAYHLSTSWGCPLFDLGTSGLGYRVWARGVVSSAPAYASARSFYDDISFWRMAVQRALGPEGGGRLSTPLLSLYLQPHVRTLWSDASGDAMGGLLPRVGVLMALRF